MLEKNLKDAIDVKAIDEGFLEKDLDSRINDYEKILTKVKQRARSIFQDSRDKSNIFLVI